MKLSNFKYIGKTGSFTNETHHATVMVKGFWPWSKSIERAIFKDAVYWQYTTTGEFTHGHEAEKLYSAYVAQKALGTIQ